MAPRMVVKNTKADTGVRVTVVHAEGGSHEARREIIQAHIMHHEAWGPTTGTHKCGYEASVGFAAVGNGVGAVVGTGSGVNTSVGDGVNVEGGVAVKVAVVVSEGVGVMEAVGAAAPHVGSNAHAAIQGA